MSSDRKTYIENNDRNESLALYLSHVGKMEMEKVPVLTSVGRVTAKAIIARMCDPTYNAAAMDGIAVFSESTLLASEVNPIILKKDRDFVYVNTGNAVVHPFDSVIMIEDVIIIDDDNIKIFAPSRPWQHIRVIGESIVASETVLTSGKMIRPIDLGAIIASGNSDIFVYKQPRVAIIPTGEEMVEDTDSLSSGKLMESNTRVFYELTKSYGALPIRLNIIPDKESELEKAVHDALSENDIVIINAGSSAGTKDFTAKIIEKMGKIVVHGLAMKPGKPTILGIINNKVVIGVPGYPISAYLVYEKIVKKVIEKSLGLPIIEENTYIEAQLTKSISSSLKNEEFVRVALGEVNGKMVASPLERGAAAVMSMVKADGIVIVPRFSEGISRGEKVVVELLKPLESIKKSLLIVGSHDPIIDIIADKMLLSSSHVGSMSGIIALKNQATHIAPIHLIDSDGEYNKSFVRQYFPQGTMALIKGLQRIQGLFVPKGNPKNITSLSMLKNKKISFANRQNGSGTRLLFDNEIKKLGIESSDILGYDKEFTTHLAVATAVKNGVFDCGLGVLSAANIMGLDFLPIGQESYDFLVQKDMLDDERIKKFISIITSRQFQFEVEELGGYEFLDTGKIEVIE